MNQSNERASKSGWALSPKLEEREPTATLQVRRIDGFDGMNTMLPFANRMSAGRLLASKLDGYAGRPDIVVAGLARGGVSVAFEIAQRLQAPLDVMVVRKVGLPWQPELALGAVASGGVRVFDQGVLKAVNLSNYFIYDLIAKQEEEVERRELLFRHGHPAECLRGRTVILADDGAATGSTMLAAAEAVRKQCAKEIVVALPVASRDACEKIQASVDKCFCLATPTPFFAVSEWYEEFPQVEDEEVQDLLVRSRRTSKREDMAFAHAAGN
jgi:putative phosphoribosyl transferase